MVYPNLIQQVINWGEINCVLMYKLPYHRISPALFALFFSHVATATLLHHKTKITQRYATPALTNIGERGLRPSAENELLISFSVGVR